MKKIKMLIALCLCLVMVFSLSVAAFACDDCFNGASSVILTRGRVTTTGNGLNMREHHRTFDCTVYGSLYTDDTMQVTKKWLDTSMTWYYVTVLDAKEAVNNGTKCWVAGINNNDENVELYFGV